MQVTMVPPEEGHRRSRSRHHRQMSEHEPLRLLPRDDPKLRVSQQHCTTSIDRSVFYLYLSVSVYVVVVVVGVGVVVVVAAVAARVDGMSRRRDGERSKCGMMDRRLDFSLCAASSLCFHATMMMMITPHIIPLTVWFSNY
jgi:hypothetical protein